MPHDTFSIFRRGELDRVIAAASSLSPWLVPVFRAVRDGRINLAMPRRDAVLTKAILEQSSRPLIILIGDDDGTETGPAGWTCTAALIGWGRGAIIHGAAGEVAHYALAVTGALFVRRFIIAECATAHQEAWEKTLSTRMETLSIRAREDSPHPKPPAPGEVN